MKIKIPLTTIVIAAIAIFSGCKKGDTGPAGANGTNAAPTGSIIGFVTLYDDNSNLIENASGANIALEGQPLLTATSDSTGRFEITKVPTGTYNIDFTKQGFAETRTVGYEFVGGANPTVITKVLNEPSSATVQLDTLSVDTNYNNYYLVNVNLKIGYSDTVSAVSYVVARIFYGLSNTVSDSIYDGVLGYGLLITSKTSPFYTSVSFNLTTYPSGTKVYFIAYGSPSTISSYINPITGKTVFPGLNPISSQVLSIVIP